MPAYARAERERYKDAVGSMTDNQKLALLLAAAWLNKVTRNQQNNEVSEVLIVNKAVA